MKRYWKLSEHRILREFRIFQSEYSKILETKRRFEAFPSFHICVTRANRSRPTLRYDLHPQVCFLEEENRHCSQREYHTCFLRNWSNLWGPKIVAIFDLWYLAQHLAFFLRVWSTVTKCLCETDFVNSTGKLRFMPAIENVAIFTVTFRDLDFTENGKTVTSTINQHYSWRNITNAISKIEKKFFSEYQYEIFIRIIASNITRINVEQQITLTNYCSCR